MLDALMCRGDMATGYWVWLSHGVAKLLSSSGFSISLLVALVTLIVLSARFRYRHRRLKSWGLTITTGLLCFSLLVPPLGQYLLVSFLPPDSGESADAIVVLGRGIDLQPQRVSAAASLFWDGRAPLIFVSGAGDAPGIIHRLERLGVPGIAVRGESCSRTTAENAKLTATYLSPDSINKIILVTDPPHMLRSMLTFRGVGFEVIPHVSPLPTRYNFQRTRFMAIRESLGFISYGLLGRYHIKQQSQSFTS